MNKKLVALAVAGAFAAPMAAQAEVSLSLQLQNELVMTDSDATADGLYLTDAQTYGNPDDGSGAGSLTVKGSEDLGNGMTALGKYSFNAKQSTGTGDRDAYIGLSGGFGTVLLGKMNTPYKSSTVKWDPFLATFMQARGNGGAQNGVFGDGSYLSDAVAYANNFGGAKVVLALGVDEANDGAADPATTGNHATSLSVNVPLGDIEVAFAMLNASDYGTTATQDRSNMKVGVKWSSGPITASATMQQQDANAGDGTYMLLNGQYKMGANNFALNIGSFTGDTAAADGTYMALGVIHSMSKNVRIHAGYRSTSYDVAVGSADETALGAGVRVKF